MKEFKNICLYCGREFVTKKAPQKFCNQLHYGKYQKELAEEEIYQVPDCKIFIRIVSPAEEYIFKNLQKAVNFLSIYSSLDAPECTKKFLNRENKIDKWKIFYD